MQTNEVLQQVICFSLEEITLWGARKKLRTEDLKLSPGELPPKDLASLGSKKIFPTTVLNKFEALKKQAHSACAKVGVRFMGGYAVPAVEADNLGKILDSIGVDFEKVKAEFIANYQTELDDWVVKHPGWEGWIRNATIPVGEVKDRINYGWTPARISSPNEDQPDNRLNQKMTKEAGGLSGRLFAEVADMARKVRDESLLGKERVNRRVLSPIRKMRGKLSGLAFLDKRVGPLVKTIDDTLAKMPGDAPVEGIELTALQGLVLMLSEPERMKEFGQAMLDGQDADTASFGVTAPEPVKSVVETQQVQQEVQQESESRIPTLLDLFADDEPIIVAPTMVAESAAEKPQVEAPQSVAPLPAQESRIPAIEGPVPEKVEIMTVEAPVVRIREADRTPPQVKPAVVPAVPKMSPIQRITF